MADFSKFTLGLFGGALVVRSDTAEGLTEALNEVLAEIDETEAPGLLSAVQTVEAAQLIKSNFRGNGNGSGAPAAANKPAASGGSGIPDWLEKAANEEGGEPRTGNKNGKQWFAVKVGDNMIWKNPPRGR